MSDLDEPTHPPTSLPVPTIDMAPPGRVADGTRTKLGAAPPPIPRARLATIPPPIPSAARDTGSSAGKPLPPPTRTAKATIPPPIPAAAMAVRSRGTASMQAAPAGNATVDPLIPPPAPMAPIAAAAVVHIGDEPSSKIEISPDIDKVDGDVSGDVDMSFEESPASLPPLPRPSQGWLATTTQAPPTRTIEPRRQVPRSVSQLEAKAEGTPPPQLLAKPAGAELFGTSAAPPSAHEELDHEAWFDAKSVNTGAAELIEPDAVDGDASDDASDDDWLDAKTSTVTGDAQAAATAMLVGAPVVAPVVAPPPALTAKGHARLPAPKSAKAVKSINGKPVALDDTPLPSPRTDSGDEWPALARAETSAVSDLFAPSDDGDVETSAKPSRPAAADVVDLFAPAMAEDSATTYFERSELGGYNRRHLAMVGIGAVALAGLVAVIVRSQMSSPADKPKAPAMPPAPAVAVAVEQSAPTAAQPVAAQPVAAPAPAAIAATAAQPTAETPLPHGPTDIPVTSTPSGATVTLISNGVPHVLGKTPLFASVDAGAQYDLVVTMTGHPTTMQHLDPRTTKQVAIAFDGASAPAAAPVAMAIPASSHAQLTTAATPSITATEVAPPPAHHHHHDDHTTDHAAPVATHIATTKPIGQIATPKDWTIAPSAKSPSTPATAAAATGPNGILMVASKPPCEIVLDGKVTHLETPQRSLTLAPGSHTVTFVNAKMHINKTVSVAIASKKPTKLIQDFTH